MPRRGVLWLVEVVSDRVGVTLDPYDNTGAAGVKVVGQRGPSVGMGTGKVRPLEVGVAEACSWSWACSKRALWTWAPLGIAPWRLAATRVAP